MDCSFAISDEEIVNMLLVEFRFNYKNLANLPAGKLRDKVSGSFNLLGESPTIHNFYIFVFNNDLIQQAKSRFSRLNPRIPNNYIVMNIYELHNVYFE